MPPTFPQDNAAYCCLVDPKHLGKFNLKYSLPVQSSDLDNIFSGKLGMIIFASSNVKKSKITRMLDVFRIGDVLEIANTVIALVPVNVVDSVLPAITSYPPRWRC